MRTAILRAALVLPREQHHTAPVPPVPIRVQLREAVERARAAARAKDERLTWQAIAEGAGITSAGAIRKMLQGDAPIDDATAQRIAAVIGYELKLVPAEKRRKR